jgi:AcrR family transcriptional regulator
LIDVQLSTLILNAGQYISCAMARRSDHTRPELTRMALDAARKVVSKQGLRGLSTRAIAKPMGYSPGTLYQLFQDLDEIILRMNAETLDGLIAACDGVDFGAGPEAALEELARRYIAYVGENRGLWNAIFEHSLPAGRESPEWMVQRTRILLGLAERAVAPLFAGGDEARLAHEAQVLWAGLYGIASLATAAKLPPGESPEAMVRTLVRNSIAGIRVQQQPKA